MKFVCSFLVCVISIGVIACGPRKPAYDGINSNQAAASENKNSSDQATAPAVVPGSESQQAGGPPPPEKFRMPPFLDQTTGQIKDLPSYPLANRVNIQYGPLQGQDTATLMLETGDTMDNIVAFYERAIKSNGWTVSDKLHDQDISNWTLKKGKDSEAKVEVRKDPQSKKLYIVIARTQAQPQPKP